MAKKTDPAKTIAEKLENSFQVFFNLFFDFEKKSFVSWIFGAFFMGFFLVGCYRIYLNMFQKTCSKKS